MSEGLGMINQTHLMCRMEHIWKESCKTRFKQTSKQKNSQDLESGVMRFQATNLLCDFKGWIRSSPGLLPTLRSSA